MCLAYRSEEQRQHGSGPTQDPVVLTLEPLAGVAADQGRLHPEPGAVLMLLGWSSAEPRLPTLGWCQSQFTTTGASARVGTLPESGTCAE